MLSRRSVIGGSLAGICGAAAWTTANGEVSRVSLPFKFLQVQGAKALEELETLARSGQGYPIILGDRKAVEQMQETMELSKNSVDELIQLSSKIDPEAWFKSRAAEDPEYYEVPRGPWPDDAEPSSISGHLDISTGKPLGEVFIGIIPVAESWNVPCALKFGGWNACPFPQEHAAILRRWNKKYGADVVTATGDVLEMRVKRPPTTRAEALVLANEQFVYCSDIVHQGTETIDALAAGLLNSPAWFFWWD